MLENISMSHVTSALSLLSNIQLRLLRISSFFPGRIMDAQGSSSTMEKFSPEAIPSTGLSIIYEPDKDAPIVDIVFVHGLKGHPYKTWRCKQNPENEGEPPADSGKEAPKSNTSKRLEFRKSLKAFLKGSSSNNRQGTSLTESTCNIPSTAETGDLSVFWPADLLSQICNKARILTFGYDTKITKFTSGPTNTNSIFSHGKDFLFSLGREYVPERPMIFVAHSLCGILVKEMLALSATSDTLAHKGIIESTAAIVFLGMPHRGSPELSAIGEWARSMLSSLKFQTTSTILDTLGLKTTDLERAHEAFCRLWHQYDFQVKTFQESFGLTGIDLGVLGNKVVSHESSLIGDPREHAETLQANHKQMSRFASAQDPNFIKVAGEIKSFYTAIDDACNWNQFATEPTKITYRQPERRDEPCTDKGSPHFLDQKVLDDVLASLRFDGMDTRRESILAPALNTGHWLVRDPTFHLWTTTVEESQRLLFIRGKPGAGKSTLMKEALAVEICNQNDILNYVTQRLITRISPYEKHWRKELTEKVHGLSSGVFLWVVLVVDQILSGYDLGTSLPGLVRQVEEMPVELEELYEKILGFDTTALGDHWVIGKMFQWVLAANRPLRLDEWHHILAFIQRSKPDSLAEWRRSEPYTENDHQLERKIKNLSRGLLEVSTKPHEILAEKNGEVSSIDAGAGSLDHEEGSARIVRFIHHSVYDFFIHKGGFRKLGLESVSPLADCHCTIANTCIDYLFIPELDEYVVARQRVRMASLTSVTLCSDKSCKTEESPKVKPQQRKEQNPGHTLEDLDILRPRKPFEGVEHWLAGGAFYPWAGSMNGSRRTSVSHESPAAPKSQVLDDYPALLVYAITEVILHIESAHLELNPTQETQNLITRLRDDAIWKRLRALQQERRTQKRTAEWLEAVAQNRLPPLLKTHAPLPAPENGPRSPRSIASFSSASSFSHQDWGSHADTNDAKNGRDEQRQTAAEKLREFQGMTCRSSSIMGVFTKFRFFNRRLALSCVLIAVSTFNYGFDNQAFATTQAMDAFDKQFGVWNEKTGKYILEPSWLSLFNSLNYIGFAAATIAVTSFHREQIMAARILNYVYVGMELGVVPTFQSEIVPAQARGFMVGSYQLSLAVGGLVINSICFGTSSLPDNRAWRIPLGMFYVVPSIVVAGIWFVPESPRWLLRKNRVEEARKSLQQIRECAFTDEEIDAEFTELKVSLEQETEQGNFVELVRGINLKRTLIVMAVNFYQQAGGQAFVSQYGTIYVKSLGTINPFGFSLITSAISIVSITCILLWTDIVGRRVLMMASSVTMFAAMMTMGGLGIVTPVDDSRKKGVISMMAVFASGFGMGWAPLVYVVTTELSALRLRDLTSRVGFTTNVIMNFTVNFSIPYLIYDKYAGLNSKVGFIFGGIMATALVFVYFCVPECKGKTLEQVDFLFNQGVPIRQFGKVDAAEMMRATQEEDGLGKVHSDGKANTVTAEERV
ncbi:RGT2-Sensor of high external glucose concentration [Fusarium coicis]|nr:RGT2-Sensor of high external glucose concentration [Fusarium coicis]